MLTYQFVFDVQITFHFPISDIIDCRHFFPSSLGHLDWYSNQACSSTFWFMRSKAENPHTNRAIKYIRRKKRNGLTEKKKERKIIITPKWNRNSPLINVTVSRSNWIQIETRKRFGELLEIQHAIPVINL